MEQTRATLLATIVLAGLALFFAIIGVATPGWVDKSRLFNCGESCPNNNISAGALLIIAIIFLFVCVLVAVMILQRFIDSSADLIKFLLLFLLLISGIFIVAAYSSVFLLKDSNNYSYHLSVTAGVLTFVSALFFSYYVGRTSVFIRSQ